MAVGFPPVPLYPNGVDSDRTLFLVFNTSEAPTVADNPAWSEEITIQPQPDTKPEIWADNGFANIDGELFYYDDVDKNTDDRVFRFKRCLRNLGGTDTHFNKACTFVRGFVIAEHHIQLVETICKVEKFVGIDFSPNEETLDFRIRNLVEQPIIFDDFSCPDVNFTFVIVDSDPASGILANFLIEINGTFTGFRLDFGDGSFTTSASSGSHRYSANAPVDPVLVVENSSCQTITTDVASDRIEDPSPPVEAPFEIDIPAFPEFPVIDIPGFVEADAAFNFPPIQFPCLQSIPGIGDVGDIPSIIEFGDVDIPSIIEFGPVDIPSIIIFGDVEIPSIIEFGDIEIPSIIEFGDVEIPSLIEFGDIDIPSLIEFGDVEIPSLIEFGDVEIPSLIEFGDIDIPSFIEFGDIDIPSFIEFGDIDIPSLIEFGAVEIPSLIEFGPVEIPSFIEFGPVEIPSFIEFGPVEIPSLIEFGPVEIPSLIEFGPVEIPSLIEFGPVEIPSLIEFGPVEIPSLIEFGPVELPSIIDFGPVEIPSIIDFGPVEIPSIIDFGPVEIPSIIEVFDEIPTIIDVFDTIPTTITVIDDIPDTITVNDDIPSEINIIGDIPSTISVDFGDPPTISVDFGDPPDISGTVSVVCPTASPFQFDSSGPTNPLGFDEIEVQYDYVAAIPSKINIIAPPSLPMVRFATDEIPTSIQLQVPFIRDIGVTHNIPNEISILLPEMEPISLIHDLPKVIKLDSDSVPSVISLTLPEDFPSIIQVAGIPDKIQVEGIPSVIEVSNMPSVIDLQLPDNPEIKMIYDGAPISVVVSLELQKIIGEDGDDDYNCVAIVPCPR